MSALKRILFTGFIVGLTTVGCFFWFYPLSFSPFQGFTEQEVENQFISYMTELHGVSKLQVTELNQVEVLSQESRRKIFWNRLELPSVVVALEVPVQYVYFVDLEKDWSFQLDDGVLKVLAPPLEFNEPSANVSAMRFKVEKTSVFRDESHVKQNLIRHVTPYLKNRAEEQKSLVEDTARKHLRETLEKWVASRLQKDLRVQVEFQQPQIEYIGLEVQ